MVPDAGKNLTIAFPVNRIKIILLNTFTKGNRKFLGSLKTNDFLVGVGYTAMMNAQTVEYGIRKAAKAGGENVVIEALFHPDSANQNGEYNIPFDQNLEAKIKEMGFKITNYAGL
jgi:hypothetical protein